MTFFISGFPGVGKSHFKDKFAHLCTDSDSSLFSKLKDGSPNPSFIEDYFKHLKSLEDKDTPLVFISTHEAVLEELKRRGMSFTIVIPKEALKEEYLERYQRRGSPKSFIDLLDSNWTPWLSDIKSKYTNYYELEQGESLTDYLIETYESL